jgi:hypothetical protein
MKTLHLKGGYWSLRHNNEEVALIKEGYIGLTTVVRYIIKKSLGKLDLTLWWIPGKNHPSHMKPYMYGRYNESGLLACTPEHNET